MSKPNPQNSTVVQILLDLEKALKCSQTANSSDMLQHVVELKSKLSNVDIRATDDIFDTHKYPSQSLTFVKCTRFTDNQIVTSLSANACKLLMFAMQIMSRDNCVLFNQTTLSNVLNMSKPTINKAIDELTDVNCIRKIVALKRKNPAGTVYMINSDIAQIGIRDNTDMFDDINTAIMYDVISTNVSFGGKHITFTHPEMLPTASLQRKKQDYIINTDTDKSDIDELPENELPEEIPDFIAELEELEKQSPEPELETVEPVKKKRGRPKKKESA